MTVTADILRRLGRLRLEPEAFEEVLTIIADVQAMEEARRLQQRERVARHRAMKRNSDVQVTLPTGYSNGHNGEAAVNTGETVFSKSEISPPSPPKGGSVPPKKPKIRKAEKPQATLCPEDLRPNESHYLKCDQRGAPRSVADRSAEIIINWSHSHADRDIAWKTDWPRALHRILDGEIEKFQRDQGGPPRGRPPPGQRISGLTALAHDKAAARQMERNREPTLDLEHRPFPTAQRGDPAHAGGSASEARRDERWPDRDGTGTVHDFPARRAFGG